MARFTIFKDKAGEYRWHFQASNNRIIAGSEGYNNKLDCAHSIDLMKRDAPAAAVYDETVPAQQRGF